MDNNKAALKSGIWYTIAKFLVRGIGFITTPIFTRLLTQQDFGAYNNYTSWLQILTIVMSLNLASTLISAKFDYKDRFDQYILSMLGLSSFSCLAWMIIFNIFNKSFTGIFGLTRLHINCMCLYILFENVITMFQTRERYYYHYKMTVFISVLNSVCTSLLAVILVIFMDNKLSGRILGAVIPAVCIGGVIYVFLYKKGKHVDVSTWRYAIPICLPFIPHLLSLVLLNSMDRIMITRICGEVDTALYSLAYTCGTIITLLVSAMNEAYAPWLGDQLHCNNYQQIRKFSTFYISIFIYFAMGIMLISPEILMILGGGRYQAAKYVMPPVAMGCICQFIYTMYVNVEQFKKKTLGMAIGSITAALLNFILNSIFIPRYGYVAAAYTTLAGFMWLVLVHMFLVHRLGLDDVYNPKFVFGAIIISFVFTCGVNAAYRLLTFRIAAIVIYTLFGILLIVKNKQKITEVISKLKR